MIFLKIFSCMLLVAFPLSPLIFSPCFNFVNLITVLVSFLLGLPWNSDTIQPSHTLSPTSPPALNLSQHQGLFQWVGSSHQVAKLLELELQHQLFQLIFRIDFLQNWLVWCPSCPRNFQVSSPAPQFKSISSSVFSFLYGPTLISSSRGSS